MSQDKKTVKIDIEDKFKKEVEKQISAKIQSSTSAKIFGEIVGYIIFLVFLYLIFPRPTFVTDDYELWRPIALWTTTAGSVLKIFKHGASIKFLKHMFEIGSLFLSIYSTYMLILIYPLDFSNIGLIHLNPVFLFALQITIFAMTIAIIVNFVKAFIPQNES